jgi:hypothetical protein
MLLGLEALSSNPSTSKKKGKKERKGNCSNDTVPIVGANYKC